MSLFTGRQLVAELARLGLGTWSADAVRQWTREEPALPIAEAADQGKPHRYQLLDTLHWLAERAKRERAKGFTSASSSQLIDRIERVQRQFITSGSIAVSAEKNASAEAPAVPSPDLALPPVVTTMPPDLLSPAKSGDFSAIDIERCTDLELVLQVVKGRNPQAWKATEEALNQRRKRLEAEGRLIPAEDLENTLDAQALATRSGLGALVTPLAQRIPDHSTFEQRRAVLQAAFDDLLQRLADHDDDADAAAPAIEGSSA